MFGEGASQATRNDSSAASRSLGHADSLDHGTSSFASTTDNAATQNKETSSSLSSTISSYLNFSPYLDSSAYWNYASDSMNYASETTYLTLASMLSPFYAAGDLFPSNNRSLPMSSSSGGGNDGILETPVKRSSFLLRMADRRYSSPSRGGGGDNRPTTTTLTMPFPFSSSSPSPTVGAGGISWSVLTKNPYNVVRGRQPINHKRQSISAVRSFLALVPVDEEEALQDFSETDYLEHCNDPFLSPLPAHARASSFGDSTTHSHRASVAASKDETASQVAEGTLRALRDLALEEALELNTALRFWSHRWERPLLSWLEAGPIGTYVVPWRTRFWSIP